MESKGLELKHHSSLLNYADHTFRDSQVGGWREGGKEEESQVCFLRPWESSGLAFAQWQLQHSHLPDSSSTPT